MDRKMKIDILLATFNGEKYLREQLNSILSQSNTNWQIIIRDDGSTDKTMIIIDEYINDYPKRFFLYKDEKGRLGSTLSYATLLKNSQSEYIMLCDQDDVWLNNKIEITLNEMLKLEKENGDLPLMVFTDLIEVDESLNHLSESFITSQKLYPSIITNATKLAALNVVAGCTVMINRIAIQFVLPLTSKNIIHDQWMAVNIAHYGKIAYLNFTTIMYRQHSFNALGSYEIGFSYFYNKVRKPLKQLRIYTDLISNLSFKMNILEFLLYKITFTFKRLLK